MDRFELGTRRFRMRFSYDVAAATDCDRSDVIRTRITLCLLLLALLLAGCGGPQPPVDNYLTRLGRSLDRDIEPAAERLAPLPRARDLQIDLLPGSIDLLDLFALRGCELNITIGKSNSSLGKVAADSQRLLLELEFLALAPACIQSLDTREDEELVTTLKAAVASKREQLPARIWNATLGGPEFRSFWKRPNRLADYPSATGSQVTTALARLAELSRLWMEGNFLAGLDELEDLLGDIRRGDGGELLASLDLQRSGLAAARPALDERLDPNPICFGKTPSPEGRIVDNVVRKYFIGEVQPWSVQVARRRADLMPPVLALEAQLSSITPAAYQSWVLERDLLLESAVAAPREHARSLAALLETCGLRPGVDPAKPG